LILGTILGSVSFEDAEAKKDDNNGNNGCEKSNPKSKACEKNPNADPPTELDDIWQYREHDTETIFDPEFTFSNTGTDNILRVDSSFNSIGNGIVFKTFDKADIIGKDIKITWANDRNGPGVTSGITIAVLDGSYDRSDNADFPSNGPLLIKGGGALDVFTTFLVFSEQTDTLTASLTGSVLEEVTVFVNRLDGHLSTSNFLEVRSIEIVGLGSWSFENSIITAEQIGTFGDFGTIETTLSQP